jgi:hypothetical protein
MEEASREQAASQQDAYYTQQAAPAEEPAYTAELERLAQLKQQGVITDDEFMAKKKQILGL